MWTMHQSQGPLGGECGSESEEPRGDPSGNLKYEKYNNIKIIKYEKCNNKI